MPRVDHPLEQWFDHGDLRLGTVHQMNDRGTYSDHPCASCGEFYVTQKPTIGFKGRAMSKNVMQGKKRGQTKGGGKKY